MAKIEPVLNGKWKQKISEKPHNSPISAMRYFLHEHLADAMIFQCLGILSSLEHLRRTWPELGSSGEIKKKKKHLWIPVHNEQRYERQTHARAHASQEKLRAQIMPKNRCMP